MQNAYQKTEDYNPRKECKVIIVFDDMISDMIGKKNLTQ